MPCPSSLLVTRSPFVSTLPSRRRASLDAVFRGPNMKWVHPTDNHSHCILIVPYLVHLDTSASLLSLLPPSFIFLLPLSLLIHLTLILDHSLPRPPRWPLTLHPLITALFILHQPALCISYIGQSCIARIEKSKEGDCEAWYFDYMKCIDKCRVPQIFKTLK